MPDTLKGLPDSWKTFYGLLGLLTATWADAEWAFDCIILQVHSEYGGSKIEPEIPQSFNRKPRYLRKAFASHPALQPHQDRLEELLLEATEVAELRHWCVHGIYSEIPEDGPMVLSKIARGGTPALQQRTMTFADIELTANRAVALGINVVLFGIGSVGIMPQDQADDLVRKLLGKDIAVLPSSLARSI